MQIFVTIDRGEIVNKRTIRKAFESLAPGRYKISIDKAKKRTNPQNSYLHGVLIPLVFEGLKDMGFDEVRTTEDAKTVLKSLFLKKTISNELQEIEIIKDTHTLTTVEFNEFIEEVIKWGAEYLGIVIPFPNEQMQMFEQ